MSLWYLPSGLAGAGAVAREFDSQGDWPEIRCTRAREWTDTLVKHTDRPFWLKSRGRRGLSSAAKTNHPQVTSIHFFVSSCLWSLHSWYWCSAVFALSIRCPSRCFSEPSLECCVWTPRPNGRLYQAFQAWSLRCATWTCLWLTLVSTWHPYVVLGAARSKLLMVSWFS